VTVTVTVIGAGRTPAGNVWGSRTEQLEKGVTLNGGVATLTKSKLAVGTHPITAQYLGDATSAKAHPPY